jgi:ribosomal protein S18 acetylase RimI-like enzyme
MAIAAQPEILDLRHFSAATLRPLLAEESRVWSERLRWDYRSSANLLLDYLDSHVLPGYVAIERDRLCGYVFCVYEQAKAVIGDVYGAPSLCADPHKVEARLIYHLLELLQNSPGIDRIETQLLLHTHGEHAAAFTDTGFEVYERLFMELELAALENAPTSRTRIPEGMELRAWRDTDFPAAGRLISLAYQGHLDARINDQYQTTAGSMRFLQNIVRFPGCGIFDAESSRVLVKRPDTRFGVASQDEIAAMLLCSRVGEDTAHVTQICVAPAYRRRGLGAMLMRESGRRLRQTGLAALTLTVTAENTSAIDLYRSLGFGTRHTFDAMVWNRPPRKR